MHYSCLAVVPPDRMARLTALDPAIYRWTFVATWADALETVRTCPVDVVMLDPLMQGEAGVADVEQLRRQFPSLPLVLYTALSPATAPILLRLGRIGIRRVVFTRFEDAPENLRRAIAKELEQATIQQVTRAFDTLFEGLPERVRSALEMALRTPDDRTTTASLAAHAGMTPHEYQGWFIRARLPVPRVVVAVLRLLFAHRLLLDPGHTVESIAEKLGYRKAQTLQTQLRTAFGMTAGELRHGLTPEAAIALLTTRYFTPAEHEDVSLALVASHG